MEYVQNIVPVQDNLFLSALVAVIPIVFFFWALAIRRMPAYKSGLYTLIIAIILSVAVYRMPTIQSLMAATQGMVFGLVPICWIIITSVFLYNITVKTGQFTIIRDSIVSITDDRRIQALLIAFSFGAFLEGSAGFGAPVAITASLLVGLGFNPLYAAGLCLIANTAPVAFGAIGAPVIAMEGPTGIPATAISKMIGRQLPFISVFIPFYLITVMTGFKRAMEVLPAIIVSGLSFALTQYFTSNFLGPELPDILSAIVSILALVVLLKFWKPKQTFQFQYEEVAATTLAKNENASYSGKEIVKAWSPFLLLTVLVTIWGMPGIKDALHGTYTGSNVLLQGINSIGSIFSFRIQVPFLHNKIINFEGETVAAFYELDLLGTAGTAIFIAAILSKFVIKMTWKDWGKVFLETIKELKFPILTILFVVAFAYVMNASGMIITLALALSRTGPLFPFVAPILGWLGVFVTGSDTSSNVLFGSLQKAAAQSVGMEPVLALSANASGGVTGKMISPQSIAVASAATGLGGKESNLLRFTISHSLFLLFILCVLTFLQTNILAWMVP